MPEPPPVPKPDLHGSINHVSITVSDLPEAMKFFAPLLKFLGYTVGGIFDDNRTGGRLTFNINESNGTAFNIWQARLDHPFEVYEPGLHHAWRQAGFDDVAVTRIGVTRKFASFDALWGPLLTGPTPSTMMLAALPAAEREAVREIMQGCLGGVGPLAITAEALAVRGVS